MSPQVMTMRIGELSRRVGVSPHVLRAWESRYGLLRPVRSSGGYRLYGTADERRVRAVLALRDGGTSAAEACRNVMRTERLEPTVHDDGRSPLSADDVRACVNAMLVCVEAFDDKGTHVLMDRLLASLNIEHAISEALMPFLETIGDKWADGSLSVAHEHFASQLVRQRLSALALSWSSGTGPVAVLACPPEERHDIPLLCLGLLLGRRGWQVRFLGADTPAPDLVEAVREVEPDALVLSATSEARWAPVVPALGALDTPPRTVIGGHGATDAAASSLGAELLPADLVEAANVVNERAGR